MLPRWLLTLLGFVSTAAATLKASEKLEFQGALYHVHRIERAQLGSLELRWLGKDGKPLRDFEGLRKELAEEGKRIAFATNGGIYENGPKPCGLTVCAGKELVPLNLNPGEGNFFLKPNGVFYVDDVKGAGVLEAAEYSRSGLKPRLATQSGPMLMRKGVLHPAFNVNSPNKRLRNAVGVHASTGQVIFVMSDRDDRIKGRVTFHQLCQFFLHLGCQDALFLDGDISDMLVDPDKDAKLTPNTFAAMFVVPR
ncbi:uncharacterized protein YigE (DUF2233 family) [Roseimicrobium gellanilyticum]|uniref:Uncharacterized protein YigE (DUF2233 family) n=1 Tax=Roseimicrobium gellanilyticum TaxID=748857 RepID=A0A366H406_9BACT|nr:phosphodiester glycosidase family protein [Roseimicrobium gellanilyticum]RBP36316.1 uncharacterized protein YigE (DUF2233 family) [Roseimicrobium gellanilyticum]